MKTLKQRTDLLLPVSFTLIIILGLFYVQLPNILHWAFYLNWLATVACIIAILLPNSQQQLSKISAAHVFKRFSLTWLYQLLLFLCYVGLCQIMLITHALDTTRQITVLYPGHQYWAHLGLFPWAIYAFIAICLTWQSQKTNTTATFSQTTLLPNCQPDQALGIIINGGLRFTAYLTLSITLSLLVILATDLFYRDVYSIQTSWSTPQLGSALLCLIIAIIIKRKKIFQKKYVKKTKLFQCLALFSTSLALLLGLAYGIISIASLEPTTAPTLLQHWLNRSWNSSWQLFSGLWWLGWAPIIAIQLAKQCQGLSIRTSVVMLLSLPILSHTLLYGLPHTATSLNAINQTLTTSPFFFWSSLSASVVLFFMLTGNKNRHEIVNLSLPAINAVKFRSFSHAQQSIVSMTLLFLALYLVSDLALVNLALVIFVLPSIFYVALLAVGKIRNHFAK